MVNVKYSRLRIHLVLFAVVVLVVPCTGCGSARKSARRNKCINDLRSIHSALQSYISQHEKLPRDKTGKFSLSELIEADPSSPYYIDVALLRCSRKSHAGIDYVLNPKVSVKDFHSKSQVIILCDKPGNQRHDPLLLLGRGATPDAGLSKDEYIRWTEMFTKGELKSAKYPPSVQ